MPDLKVIQGLKMRTRDNVILSCDLYRPDNDVRYPAVLMRTPYLKEAFANEWLYSGYQELALAGYNVVIQDVRGTGESQGTLLSSGGNELADGYDAVEWVAGQSWCDGSVGMYGLSYFGFTQMAAAAERPPHLKCICPFQNSALQPFSITKAMTLGIFHLMWLYGRVLDNLHRSGLTEREQAQVRDRIRDYQQNWSEVMFRLPLRETEAARIPNAPLLMDFVDIADGIEDEAYWRQARRPVPISKIVVPMFFLTGWFDAARDGTLDNYAEIMQNGTENARRRCRLVIGPWLHGGVLDSVIDGVDFGSENSGKGYGADRMTQRWFDRYLKGKELPADAPVSIFVLGENRWRDEQEWPLARAVFQKLYLQGGVNRKNGRLAAEPLAADTPQHFTYDPDNPQPSAFGDADGKTTFADPAALENREDVLVFRSGPMLADTEVTGCVKLILYAATSAVDTDFFCRISDTAPDGHSFPLSNGIIRARFRDGRISKPVEPGKVYTYALEIGNICNLFKAGHQIRIDLSSSSYPAHDRNLNSGERIGWGKTVVVAEQTVYHDAAYPSHLLLPVIPR